MVRSWRWFVAAALIAAACWWGPSLVLRVDDRLWTLELYRRDTGYFTGRPITLIKDAWGRSFVWSTKSTSTNPLGPRTPFVYSCGPDGVDDGGGGDDIDSWPEPVDKLALDVVATIPWLGLVLAALVLRRGLSRRPRADEPWPRGAGVAFAALIAFMSGGVCRDLANLVPPVGPALLVDPIWSALLVVFGLALASYARLWRLAAERAPDDVTPDRTPGTTP